MHRVENQWADYFAKMGAMSIAVPEQQAMETKLRLRDAIQRAKYYALAATQIIAGSQPHTTAMAGPSIGDSPVIEA